MKKLQVILSTISLSLLIACGSSKTTTADSQSGNRGRTNSEVSATRNTTTGSRTATVSETTATNRAATAAAEKARMQKMYAQLGMSQAQIDQYERTWNTELNTWKRNNRNQTMNSFEYTETQDRILKNILDAEQFNNYQKWARENAATRGE